MPPTTKALSSEIPWEEVFAAIDRMFDDRDSLPTGGDGSEVPKKTFVGFFGKLRDSDNAAQDYLAPFGFSETHKVVKNLAFGSLFSIFNRYYLKQGTPGFIVRRSGSYLASVHRYEPKEKIAHPARRKTRQPTSRLTLRSILRHAQLMGDTDD